MNYVSGYGSIVIMKKIDLLDKKVFVLAGNNQEARDYFCSKNVPYDPRKVIHDLDCLRGLQNFTLICVGTYHWRNDRSEIMAIVNICKARLVYD